MSRCLGTKRTCLTVVDRYERLNRVKSCVIDERRGTLLLLGGTESSGSLWGNREALANDGLNGNSLRGVSGLRTIFIGLNTYRKGGGKGRVNRHQKGIAWPGGKGGE